MRLGRLMSRLAPATLRGRSDLEVTGLSHDSREIREGWIFAALPGQHQHGLEHLDQALVNGARAVLSDRMPASEIGAPIILSDQPRQTMATASWALAGDPQKQLVVIGVTGTNGKSTVVDLVATILRESGRLCGVIGTLGYDLVSEVVAAGRTTPEASELAPMLARILEAGGRYVAMEVSSHALMQHRVGGLIFDVAAWTNLTRDHLDFHGDMEEYYRAKQRLFRAPYLQGGVRVLPAGEPWAERLQEDSRGSNELQPASTLTWGLGQGRVRADDVQLGIDGSRLRLQTPSGASRARLGLIGRHNLSNALTAAAVAHGLGLSVEAICKGLQAARPAPGRLERVETPLRSPIFVDYAHTPEGLRAVLAALREVSGRRLVVVFGAGGERDRGKREPMGQAVGELADIAIVTSDNPRSESPERIAEEVALGVRKAGKEPIIAHDRRQAITEALVRAQTFEDQSPEPELDSVVASQDEERPGRIPSASGVDRRGCVVVIAGKGHEQKQMIGDREIPFCDRQTAVELARELSCA